MDRMLKYCDNSNYLEIERLSFGISNNCMLLWAKAAVCVSSFLLSCLLV